MSDDFQKQLDALKAENDKLKVDNQKHADFRAQVEKEKQDAKKNAIFNKRKEIESVLETAVKEEKITPAMRERFTKILRLDDDQSVDSLEVKDVKELIGDKAEFSNKDQGMQDDKSEVLPENLGDATVDGKLVELTHRYMAEKNEKNFSVAYKNVMRLNPSLARAYVKANG